MIARATTRTKEYCLLVVSGDQPDTTVSTSTSSGSSDQWLSFSRSNQIVSERWATLILPTTFSFKFSRIIPALHLNAYPSQNCFMLIGNPQSVSYLYLQSIFQAQNTGPCKTSSTSPFHSIQTTILCALLHFPLFLFHKNRYID